MSNAEVLFFAILGTWLLFVTLLLLWNMSCTRTIQDGRIEEARDDRDLRNRVAVCEGELRQMRQKGGAP